MREVSLFIAMSLDGYIADSEGSVDWLTGQGGDNEIDTYAEFVKEVDTILMGWNTYYQVATELSPDKWVYDDFITYVVTHRKNSDSEKIKFTNEKPVELVKNLKKEKGKGIWVNGGANVIQQLVNENLIDIYYITVIPTILGSGIKLFGNRENEIKLKLVKTQSHNGMVDLVYTRR